MFGLSGLGLKLAIGFLVISVVSALSLGLYKKIVQPTTDTDYTNTIKKAQQIIIDQRQLYLSAEDVFVLGKIGKLKIFTIEASKPDLKKAMNDTQLIIPEIPKPKNTLNSVLLIVGLTNLIGLIIYVIYDIAMTKFKQKCNKVEAKT
jgi:hypothetical protein